MYRIEVKELGKNKEYVLKKLKHITYKELYNLVKPYISEEHLSFSIPNAWLDIFMLSALLAISLALDDNAPFLDSVIVLIICGTAITNIIASITITASNSTRVNALLLFLAIYTPPILILATTVKFYLCKFSTFVIFLPFLNFTILYIIVSYFL